MVAGCGNNCMKYILFFFNVIFFIAGLGLVAFGAMMMVMMDSLEEQLKQGENQNVDYRQYLTIIAIVLLASGFILMAICFFGCCGAIKEVKCMLGTYAILVFFVIVGEIVIVAYMFMFRAKINSMLDVVNDGMRDKVRSYGSVDRSVTDYFDDLHQTLKCCGVDSYEDYSNKAKSWADIGTKTVPDSCCVYMEGTSIPEDKNCPAKPNYSNSYIGKPCAKSFSLEGIVGMFFFGVIAVAFGLIAIEVIGVIFAICLIRSIGEPRAVPV